MASLNTRVIKLEKERTVSNKEIILIMSDLLQGKRVCNDKLELLAIYETKSPNSLRMRL